MDHLFFVSLLILAYLVGSVPSGLLLVKLFRGDDIRSFGSGNIGATNAVRVGGKLIGALTFIIDAFKGILAILLCQYISKILGYSSIILPIAAGLCAILGHIFPLWLKFQGGKGVATSIGVITYCAPFIGVCGILTWAGVFTLTRISSLASLSMMGVVTVASFFLEDMYIIGLNIALTVLIYIKHIPNIKRLLAHTEQKF